MVPSAISAGVQQRVIQLPLLFRAGARRLFADLIDLLKRGP
jgi:hypothetical protein